MKILITGGCGFLGANLASRTLSEKRSRLVILDNLARKGSAANLEWLNAMGAFKFCRSDMRDANAVNKIVKNTPPDVVFHLAGQVSMLASIANPAQDFEINALGTLNLLEALRRYSPKAVVAYSSTNKVYGDLEWMNYRQTPKRYTAPDFPEGFPEDIPLDFHSPYGCSKGCAEQYMLDYHRIYGMRTVVFRHSSMYGGRQFPTYDQGWVGWFCQKALETKRGALRRPFTISGNGKQVRDVLYADDMVELYFKAVQNIERAKGEAFNIGGGMKNSLSLLELFELLEKELDIKLRFRKLPARESDQKVFVACVDKAKNLLGWRPETDKLSGIRKMLRWGEKNV
jgi:CDP-paratose 2-epimerase